MLRGINLAESHNVFKSISSNICFFLSHKSEDKKYIERVGKYIMDSGFNIYLDKNDDELQIAVKNFDSKKITMCIESGIRRSSHIICLVSDSTQKSWWVPYELGYAKKSDIEIYVMKRKGSERLPGYLTIERSINKISELDDILNRLHSERDSSISINKLLLETNKIILKSTISYENHPLRDYLK